MEEQLCGWLRVCIVFGIYMRPPNDRVGDINGKASIRSTRQLLPPQQLYICLIALTLCALYIHGLCWCGSLPTLQLTWVASLILFSFQVLTNFLILMETVWRHRQHAAFLQLLAQIEVALKLRLRQCTHSAALQRNLCYIIVRLVVFSLVTLILFMITSIWLNYIGFFWNGLWSILTMRIRVIQLLLYVRMLQHYLECLCVKLQQVVEFHVSPQRQLLDIDYSRLTTVEYLLAIKEVYTLIHDAFQLLNYCAGWSLFGIVVCFMFDVSCNVYWTVLSLDNWQNRRYYYIAGPVALLPLLVIICYLCVLCGKCKELVIFRLKIYIF
ncbi:putative gustatory receptor 39b [Ceratitis capitata]|uniref:putative gustatory receptor 39b n=1 Tax=Ceratitis capitata TaxID=7213 RepID=UPI000329B39F|nr:putative gustatory receptor 39b [Ceratitis capitata]